MLAESTTPVNERDSARTPGHVFQYAMDQFGVFDIDLASDDMNKLCSKHFTVEDDALAQDWEEYGELGWCNPPYSDITPWLIKAHSQAHYGFSTCLLVPTLNGEKWGEFICQTAAEIHFIFPRVNFLRPNGSVMSGNRGSMLVWYPSNRFGYGDTPVVFHTNMKSWGESTPAA